MNEKFMEIPQDLAKKMFEEGACCALTGIQSGSEFGIDMKSWNTGDKFLGLKMIPPGFHYIYCSMANVHGDVSPRVGFVWFTETKDILLKKWNEAEGKFDDEPDEMIDRFKANLRNVDQNLGPYPYEIWDKWKNLTSEISKKLATKLTPCSGAIFSVLQLEGSSDAERKSVKKEEETPKRKRTSGARFSDVDDYGDRLPSLKILPESEIRYSKIPEQCYPPNSTPSDITKHSLDSSYLLETILSQNDRQEDLLGELQFAYVAFLVGHSLDSFEHWKRLIGIFCSVQDSLKKLTTFYSTLIDVLKPQLDEIPEDFLVDIVASRNFIYQSLRLLFRNIITDCKDGRLKAKALRFQDYLNDKFQWDFSDILDEDEDEQPVVVQI